MFNAIAADQLVGMKSVRSVNVVGEVSERRKQSSGRAVAARLRRHRGHLRKTFPEVWQLILQRHAQYRKQELSRKQAVFAETVRNIAIDLLMAGKYPSRRRVVALMGDSELRGEHFILPEVRRAVLAFRSSSIATTEEKGRLRCSRPCLLECSADGSEALVEERYSYRSATMGSTFVARRAGM
jgi:hypothetical protein